MPTVCIIGSAGQEVPSRESQEVWMNYRLDPAVLDRAKQVTSATSDEQLGQQFLTKTGSTVRNYRIGKTG